MDHLLLKLEALNQTEEGSAQTVSFASNFDKANIFVIYIKGLSKLPNIYSPDIWADIFNLDSLLALKYKVEISGGYV